MASITSLGEHSPSALQYLIDEGHIHRDAGPNTYSWTTAIDDQTTSTPIFEEIICTDTCVAWSRGGQILRLFDFSVEQQKVSQALLTWFPNNDDARDWLPTAGSEGLSKRRKVSQEPSDNGAQSRGKPDRRALIIFLKLQAHIYFLSGASHVVNLPFEVEKALPAPIGVLLQRRVAGATEPPTPVIPGAPPNSFYSSFLPRTPKTPVFTRLERPTQPKSHETMWQNLDFDDLRSSGQQLTDDLPKHFAFTDPLSDMGFVMQGDAMKASRDPKASGQHVSGLSRDEDIVYVSPVDELAQSKADTTSPLTLVVTRHRVHGNLTAWQALYSDTSQLAAWSDKKKTETFEKKAKRRSSFAPSAVGTPKLKGRENARESLPGTAKSKAKVRPSLSAIKEPEVKLTDEERLVSQLDLEVQRPAKEARRVSSFLSRAEFSSSFDRFAFQDLAASQISNVSSTTYNRRGHSFGFTTDGHGLGVTTRQRMRASTPGAFLRIEPEESFEDLPDTQPMDLDLKVDLELAGAMSKRLKGGHPFEAFRRELTLYKIGTIPMVHSYGDRQSMSAPSTSTQTAQLKIFTIRSPPGLASDNSESSKLYIMVMQYSAQTLHQAEIKVDLVPDDESNATINGDASSPLTKPRSLPVTSLRGITKATTILDANLIREDNVERLILAPLTRRKGLSISLATPWAPDCTTEFVLGKVRTFGRERRASSRPSQGDPGAGFMRTQTAPKISSISHGDCNGSFDIISDDGNHHRLRIAMDTRDQNSQEILKLCRAVLPLWMSEWIHKLWWTCRQHDEDDSPSDFDAVMSAVMAFVYSCGAGRVISFDALTSDATLKSPSNPKAKAPRASTDNLRASAQEDMWSFESSKPALSPSSQSAWSWMLPISEDKHSSAASLRTVAESPSHTRFFKTKSTALTTLGRDEFAEMARMLREQSDTSFSSAYSLVLALHLWQEQASLDDSTTVFASGSSVPPPVNLQCAHWVGWQTLTDEPGNAYQSLITASSSALDRTVLPAFEDLVAKKRQASPPVILEWIEQYLIGTDIRPLLSLQTINKHLAIRDVDSISDGPSQKTLHRVTTMVTLFDKISRADSKQALVDCLIQMNIDAITMSSMPSAISSMLAEAMYMSRATASSAWSDKILRLAGRDDLILESECHHNVDTNLSTVVTVPTRDTHAICHHVEQTDGPIAVVDEDRMAVSRLVFSEDRRFIEALRMIEPVRVTTAECQPDSSWDEAQLLEAQKEVVQHVMIRTFALAPGLSMAHYASRRPLLTEKFVIHGYSTMCVMRPLNNTVMADRTNFTEEKYGWAWFHAGVAAGLAISPDAEGIDTSWIVFNKPSEPNHRHAGLLLALGLNGHLRNIARWLAFKYLSPKHTMTSIGLLLGMSASFLGTMDTLVTRLLSVHVTRMLPAGAAELNLSPLAQTAGLMGIGFLYHNTQHRRMSEIMLSEIENTELGDAVGSSDSVRDECYRLSAGLALGFINIAQGGDLQGLRDMHLVERLLTIAVGPKPVSQVHILQQASAGATIAIALIFMKTENRTMARKIDVPDTIAQYEFVRPDILLLRTMAKHIILWDGVQANTSWIKKNMPREYKHIIDFKRIDSLETEHMPLYCIISGLLWSIGLKYAGSCDTQVRDFLISYLDQFIRICRLPAMRYDAKLTRNTARNCQDLLALCAASVMAGTGDLEVMRRLRRLHGRVNATTPYGSHLAAHMALGALFIGGGNYTFGTSNLAIASMICAFYPLFPTDVTDNKAHLQAFRHFWALAVESRCLIVRETSSHRAIKTDIRLVMRDGSEKTMSAPGIVPSIDAIARIETLNPEFWPVILDLQNNKQHLENFKEHQTIHVRKRQPQEIYDLPFAAAFASPTSLSTRDNINWTWLFTLKSLADFKAADMYAILPDDGQLSSNRSVLFDKQETSVDQRLSFIKASRSSDRQSLWQLRLIFAWCRWWRDRNGGRMKWIDQEFYEKLQGVVEQRVRDSASTEVKQ